MRRRHLWFGLWLALMLAWDSGAWGQTWEEYFNEGLQRYNRSDFRGAIEPWERGLALAKEQGHLQATGAFLNNLGNVYQILSDYPKALEFYGQALAIAQTSPGDRNLEGRTLLNLGNVYVELGDYPKALEFYRQALATQLEMANSLTLWTGYNPTMIADRAGTLNSLGNVYADLGDYPKALEHYQQALVITRVIVDRAGEGVNLNNLGTVYESLGDYPKAREFYEQALAVFRDIESAPEIRSAEANLGDVYLAQGRLKEALAIFERVNASIRLGRYYLHVKDYRRAQERFARSLSVNEAQRDAGFLLADYIGLGLAHEGLKDYAKAKEYYRKAVDFIEHQREALTESQRRQFFGAKVQHFSRLEPYEGLARVSVYLQDAAEGLYWAEHTKARLLLEALARHGAENTLGLPKELAQEERDLSNRLAATYKQLDIAFEKKNTERYRELEQALPQLKKDQDAFIARLRKDYPDYAAIRYPQPVRVEALKLGPNEVLIEYEVTEAATFAWLIKEGKVLKTLTIPVTRQALEEQVKRYRGFFEASSTAELAHQLPAFDPRLGKALYDQLFAELAPFVQEDDQIVLIPDEILGILPFEALVLDLPTEVKAAAGKYGPYPEGVRYLGEVYALSYAQSATALSQTRALKQTQGEKGKPLLVVADPVFDEQGDERVRQARREGQTLRLAQGSSPLNFMAAAKDFEKVVLNRLDATAQLPGQLRRLYEEVDVLTGLAASEPQVKYSLPRPYRYQVLATHGILDEQVPYIQEPALVLSQVVSLASQEADPTPGFLTLTEVMNLKLNTELVALTACSTGVGKQVTGEGVMGLGRAFQYAGARGVLMSLWNVDEASTVLLIERFFGYLQQGKNKLEALRQARAEVRQAGYEHPFFWAPFILVGER